jgi:alkaline phosphatase
VLIAAVGFIAYSTADRGVTPSPVPPTLGTVRPTDVASVSPDTSGPGPSPAEPSPAASVRVIAAGDIARCDSKADDQTAALVASMRGTVLVLGDAAYEKGSATDFAACYGPSWGPLLERTWAAPGNHDHVTAGAAGYFDEFGDRAGPNGRGWYSFELGAWHVVSLDSECSVVGGCGSASPQGRWLSDDLAAHPAACLLAFWHRPRFSSGLHGSDPSVDGLWRALAGAGADIVLNGHDHDYERFDPLAADGSPDPSGIREFVVGTGGAGLRPFLRHAPSSAFRDATVHGVLALTLSATGYDWAFLKSPDGTTVDRGTGSCQGANPP